MNKVMLMGRLTRDPEIRYTSGNEPLAIANYTLAINRPRKTVGQEADFIKCSAIGRLGEFAEKYLKKGMKIAIVGHILTGSYTNRDGININTFEVIVEDHYFCESKAKSSADGFAQATQAELPFN